MGTLAQDCEFSPTLLIIERCPTCCRIRKRIMGLWTCWYHPVTHTERVEAYAQARRQKCGCTPAQPNFTIQD